MTGERGSKFHEWYQPLSALTEQEMSRYLREVRGNPSTTFRINVRRQIIDDRPNPNPTTEGGVRRRQ